MRIPRIVAVAAAALAVCSCVLTAAERSEVAKRGGEPKFWPDVADQAEVIVASFLGGKNTDWLCGGGFQPDGTVVVAGDCLGPELGLAIPETVIGTDLPRPGEYKPVPMLDRGKPKTDKDGKPVFEKPGWRHANATGFVVRLSGDLKRILSVARLPWASGAITTAAVDPKDGSVYIAGRAGDEIAKLGGDVQAMEIPADVSRKEGPCDHTFL
ncbi:MAG: hypothetical protein ABSH20_30495, partial [Tepidisphaeraceae bacterium]